MCLGNFVHTALKLCLLRRLLHVRVTVSLGAYSLEPVPRIITRVFHLEASELLSESKHI